MERNINNKSIRNMAFIFLSGFLPFHFVFKATGEMRNVKEVLQVEAATKRKEISVHNC